MKETRKNSLLATLFISMFCCLAVGLSSLGSFIVSASSLGTEKLVTATNATVTTAQTIDKDYGDINRTSTATGLKVEGTAAHSIAINGIFTEDAKVDLAIGSSLGNQQVFPAGSYFKVEDATNADNYFTVEFYGTGWNSWYTGVCVKYSKDGTDYTRTTRYDTGAILTSASSTDPAQVLVTSSQMELTWEGDVLSVIVPQSGGNYNTICAFDGEDGAYGVPKLSFSDGYKISYHLTGAATTIIEEVSGTSFASETVEGEPTWYTAYLAAIPETVSTAYFVNASVAIEIAKDMDSIGGGIYIDGSADTYSGSINGVFTDDFIMNMTFTSGLVEGQNKAVPAGTIFKVEDVTDSANYFTVEFYNAGWYTGVAVRYGDYVRTINYWSGEIYTSNSTGENVIVNWNNVSIQLQWSGDVLSVIVPQLNNATSVICAFDGEDGTYGVPKISFPDGYKVSFTAPASAMLITSINGQDLSAATVSKPTWFNRKGASDVYSAKVVDENGVTMYNFYTTDGGSVILEASDVKYDGVLVGWDIDGALYSVGGSLALTENIVAKAVYADITLKDGASIRLGSEEYSGIRWYGLLATEDKALLDEYGGVSFKVQITSPDKAGYMDIDINNWITDGEFAAEGYTEFRAVIKNIAASEYTVHFMPTVIITINYADGTTEEISVTAADGIRSIQEVAASAFLDYSDTQTEEYAYAVTVDGEAKYSRFSEEQRSILSRYAESEINGILIAADADEGTLYAATLLQENIQQSMGIKVIIGTTYGQFVSAENVIHLNTNSVSTELNEDGFEIVQMDNGIAIQATTEMGLINGVNYFSEEYLNLQYLTPAVIYVGEAQFTMDSVVAYQDAPDFSYRAMEDRNSMLYGASGIVKNGYETVAYSSSMFSDQFIGHYHALRDWAPEGCWVDCTGDYEGWKQVNITALNDNTDGYYDALKETIDAALAGNPDAKYILLGLADAPVDETSFTSKDYYNFINKVAKDYSNYTIVATAYWDTLSVPSGVTFESNVDIMYCMMLNDRYSENYSQTSGDRGEVADWKSALGNDGSRIWMYMYSVSFNNLLYWYECFDSVKADLSYFNSLGVQHMHILGSSYATHFYESDLQYYMFSKLMWDTTLDVNTIIDGFNEMYFGQFSNEADSIISLIRSAATSGSFSLPVYDWSNEKLSNVYTTTKINGWRTSVQSAIESVKNSSLSDEEKEIYVKRFKGIDVQLLYMLVRNAVNSYDAIDLTSENGQLLLQMCQEIGVEYLAEGAFKVADYI